MYGTQCAARDVRRSTLVGVALALAAGTGSPAVFAGARGEGGALPTARPEEVGMSTDRLQRIGDLLERAAAEQVVSGAVTLVARRGKVVHYQAHGLMEIEARLPHSFPSKGQPLGTSPRRRCDRESDPRPGSEQPRDAPRSSAGPLALATRAVRASSLPA